MSLSLEFRRDVIVGNQRFTDLVTAQGNYASVLDVSVRGASPGTIAIVGTAFTPTLTLWPAHGITTNSYFLLMWGNYLKAVCQANIVSGNTVPFTKVSGDILPFGGSIFANPFTPYTISIPDLSKVTAVLLESDYTGIFRFVLNNGSGPTYYFTADSGRAWLNLLNPTWVLFGFNTDSIQTVELAHGSIGPQSMRLAILRNQ